AVLYSGHWSVIEIKLVHPGDGREATVTEGLEQLMHYRDSIDRNADAWLVVFDRTPAGRQKTWEERMTWEERETARGGVTVVGG
ncbi:MAG: hypothetical protein WCQ50_22055, partial [Spirochaetota bacterium]